MKTKTSRYYIYYTLKILFFLVGLLPLKISLTIADFLGRIAFRQTYKYRKIAIDNLDAVFSDDHESNVRLARRVFVNLAKNAVEWVKLYSIDPKAIGSVVTGIRGAEYLDEALSSGKGAVVLGFHFGNWELLGIYLRLKGYKGALIARRIYFHKYDKFLTRLRKRFDAPVIYRDESPKTMLKVLRRGEVLGILADQDIDHVDGVFVDFFGRPTFTPTAPVKFAMAAKAKLVPIFVVRKQNNMHELVVERPIDMSPGNNTEEVVKSYTQAWTNVLEKYVRRYPEQWVWLHRRWKTKPA